MRSLWVPRIKPMPPSICTAWSAQNCMVCVAWFFNRHTCATQSASITPSSACTVTACTQARVDSRRIFMSTSLWRTTWWFTSAWPKVLRWRAQASASSKQHSAKPSAMAAMDRRSPLKLPMIILKPAPSWPIKKRAGTRTSSKCSCAVSEQCQPILRKAVRCRPGESPGTSNIEMPPGPLFCGSVRTATVSQSARMPEVMKTFSPLST